jgi:hypothetical protein
VKNLTLLVALVVASLVGTASPTLAIATMGRHVKGMIQKVDAQAQDAELLQPGKIKTLRFTWDRQTKFVANLRLADAAILRLGASVEIIYYHPFFGDPYATKVKLLSRSRRLYPSSRKQHVNASAGTEI